MRGTLAETLHFQSVFRSFPFDLSTTPHWLGNLTINAILPFALFLLAFCKSFYTAYQNGW
jgi:hypothetical protein